MNTTKRIGRWVSGMIMSAALCGLVIGDAAWGQGRGGGGPRGGGGGAGFRGGPGGGGQGGGGQGLQRGPGGGQGGNGNMAGQQGGGGNGECMMGQGGPGGTGGSGGSTGSFQSMVQAAMGLDANQDGVLTVNEVPDPRMQGMMSVADTDADGVVTQQEFARMVQFRMGARGGQGGGVGGGPGSDEMIPGVLRNQNELELSAEQQSRLAELQMSVEKRILGILTKEQRSRYQKMKQSDAGAGGGASVSAGSGRPQKQSVKATAGS